MITECEGVIINLEYSFKCSDARREVCVTCGREPHILRTLATVLNYYEDFDTFLYLDLLAFAGIIIQSFG